MSDEITPAMTAEELIAMKPTAWLPNHAWPRIQAELSGKGFTHAPLNHLMHGDNPHHHQPVFVGVEAVGRVGGFTWDDVTATNIAASLAIAAACAACGNGATCDEPCNECLDAANAYKSRLHDLANRIAALLPPREEKP